MNRTNEPDESVNNDQPMTPMERLKNEAAGCGPGCGCGSSSGRGGGMWFGVVILGFAALLVVRALTQTGNAPATAVNAEYPSVVTESSTSQAKPLESTQTGSLVSIQSLADLNQVAGDLEGVFLMIADSDATRSQQMLTAMEKATSSLSARQIRMGLFSLDTASVDFTNITRQLTPPFVLTLVKGRGMAAVSNDITDERLIQSYVSAGFGGGCGGGCGSGCQ